VASTPKYKGQLIQPGQRGFLLVLWLANLPYYDTGKLWNNPDTMFLARRQKRRGFYNPEIQECRRTCPETHPYKYNWDCLRHSLFSVESQSCQLLCSCCENLLCYKYYLRKYNVKGKFCHLYMYSVKTFCKNSSKISMYMTCIQCHIHRYTQPFWRNIPVLQSVF
jgi:hypothetical protein